jgi:hypothetical protein
LRRRAGCLFANETDARRERGALFSNGFCISNERQVVMSNMNSVVAVFGAHDQAEDAIRELQKDGFDMKKLSIVGKDYHTEENVVGYYTSGDRMMYWGKLGAFWGGFWGLLFGSAFFWVPAVSARSAPACTASVFRRTVSCSMRPR